jgi:hypothetical protein
MTLPMVLTVPGSTLKDVPKQGILFPTREGEEPMVGFPLVLPMGWMQSPPLFTAATETLVDLASRDLHAKLGSGPHFFRCHL